MGMLANLPRPDKQIATKLAGTADAYRQSVARRCRTLFPSFDPNMLPSAYTARHQRKVDCKRSGVSRIELAKLVGQRTTRSAVYDGAGVRGRSGTVKPAAVRATSEAKVRPNFRLVSVNKHSATNPRRSERPACDERRFSACHPQRRRRYGDRTDGGPLSMARTTPKRGQVTASTSSAPRHRWPCCPRPSRPREAHRRSR